MQKQLIYKDIEVNYSKSGEGKTIFLIHGFCEEHSMWDGVIGELSKQYTLILPDLPGHGKSSCSEEEMTVVWMAEMINAIMTEEKIDSATIMGHSLGGYVAIHFAELFPGKTEALGFINSHVFEDDNEKKQNRKKSIDFILKHTAKLFIRELINNLFSEEFKMENKDLVLSLISQTQQTMSDKAVIAALQAMAGRDDKSSVLVNFTGSFLFLIGKKDATIPLDISLSQISLPAQCDVHIRNNAAHMSVYEDRPYSAQALLDFVNRNNNILLSLNN